MYKLFKSPWSTGITIFVVAILVFTTLKSVGIHFSGLGFVRGNLVYVENIDKDTKIFLDNRDANLRESSEGLFIKNVAPGEHTVLVVKDMHWPWTKSVNVLEDETNTISPFLISKNVSGVIVTDSDPEYKDIISTMNRAVPPDVESKKISVDGNIAIWTDNDIIFAEWIGNENLIPKSFCVDGECASVIEVVKSQSEIRGLDFYKTRNDVLVLASQTGIFAIEINKSGNTQNFQPIYKGTGVPKFSVKNEETIYILDGGILYIVFI